MPGPPPGDLPNPGIKPRSPALQAESLPSEPPGKSNICHLMRRVDSLEKTDAGRDWGQEEKGTAEDEMAGWHHRLDGREFE